MITDIYEAARIEGLAPNIIKKNPTVLFPSATTNALTRVAYYMGKQLKLDEQKLEQARETNMIKLSKKVQILDKYTKFKNKDVKYRLVIANSIGFPTIAETRTYNDLKQFLASMMGYKSYTEVPMLTETLVPIAEGQEYVINNKKGELIDIYLSRYY